MSLPEGRWSQHRQLKPQTGLVYVDTARRHCFCRVSGGFLTHLQPSTVLRPVVSKKGAQEYAI